MALTYPKSRVECGDGVFDGQINDENSYAALSKIDDKFGCMGYPPSIAIRLYRIEVQGYAMLIF